MWVFGCGSLAGGFCVLVGVWLWEEFGCGSLAVLAVGVLVGV